MRKRFLVAIIILIFMFSSCEEENKVADSIIISKEESLDVVEEKSGADTPNEVEAVIKIEENLDTNDLDESESQTEVVETQGIEWNDYLYNSILSQSTKEVLGNICPGIILDDYIEDGSILIESYYVNNYGAYLIDFDGDDIDELIVHRKEGSGGDRLTEIFVLQDGVYYRNDHIPTIIYPIIYEGEYHFVSYDHDFETKFLESVIDYEIEDKTLIPKTNYEVAYSYEAESLDEIVSDIIDVNYLNSLEEYPSLTSAEWITYDERGASDVVEVYDESTSNSFSFNIRLKYTSVHHLANYWEIASDDEFTSSFSGINNIFDDFDVNENGHVIYNANFIKRNNELYFVTISYPYYTMEPKKSAELTLKLYRFEEDVVKQIFSGVIAPNIKIECTNNFHWVSRLTPCSRLSAEGRKQGVERGYILPPKPGLDTRCISQGKLAMSNSL